MSEVTVSKFPRDKAHPIIVDYGFCNLMIRTFKGGNSQSQILKTVNNLSAS